MLLLCTLVSLHLTIFFFNFFLPIYLSAVVSSSLSKQTDHLGRTIGRACLLTGHCAQENKDHCTWSHTITPQIHVNTHWFLGKFFVFILAHKISELIGSGICSEPVPLVCWANWNQARQLDCGEEEGDVRLWNAVAPKTFLKFSESRGRTSQDTCYFSFSPFSKVAITLSLAIATFGLVLHLLPPLLPAFVYSCLSNS